MSKRIAVCFKGIFNIRNIISNNGANEKLILDLKESICHNKKMVYDNLDGKIDYYYSTYDISENIDNIIKEKVNPVSYSFLDNKILGTNTDSTTWKCQFTHYKNLISRIEEYQKENQIEYDIFIFTRQDIKYLIKFESMNVDFDKFNIVNQYSSQYKNNCDDGLWIFSKKYFEKFKKTIQELDLGNKLTHEINHFLKKNGVDINYMQAFDPTATLSNRLYTVYSDPYNCIIDKCEWKKKMNRG